MICNARGRLAPYLDAENEAVQRLLKEGVAIVRACSAAEADELRKELWDDLEALGTGIDRNDPETWKNSNWPQTTHGLLQNQSFGLRIAVCMARLKCVQVFKKLFKDVPVNSSFDAISVVRPDSQERSYKKEVRLNERYREGDTLLSSWLHIDQANCWSEVLRHIQAAFALEELGEAEQRTQFVLPKPGETIQQFRDRFLAAFPPPKDPPKKGSSDPERAEWISFALDDNVEKTDPVVIAKRKWLLANGRIYTPTLQKGEMVLWLSAVPHASIPGPCPAEGERRTRVVTFVSMLPAAEVTDKERAVRNEMLESLDTSGHRVTAEGKKGKVLKCKFTKTGRTYGKELPAFDESRVVKASKRALAESDEPEWSVARKTQRLCAGAGI